MTEQVPLDANIKVQWTLDPTTISGIANQILIEPGAATSSGEPDGVYVTFGHLNPPLFSLTPGTLPTQEMIDEMVLPIVPIARMFVTVDRMRDFAAEIHSKLALLPSKGVAES